MVTFLGREVDKYHVFSILVSIHFIKGILGIAFAVFELVVSVRILSKFLSKVQRM